MPFSKTGKFCIFVREFCNLVNTFNKTAKSPYVHNWGVNDYTGNSTGQILEGLYPSAVPSGYTSMSLNIFKQQKSMIHMATYL